MASEQAMSTAKAVTHQPTSRLPSDTARDATYLQQRSSPKVPPGGNPNLDYLLSPVLDTGRREKQRMGYA